MSAPERFTPEVLEAIRQNTDIVALVARTLPLQRKGRAYWARCPFHKDATPSFKVENERRAFHCFGCGEYGDAFDWLIKTTNLTFPEAVNELAGGSRKLHQSTPNHTHSTQVVPAAAPRALEAATVQRAKANALWRRGCPATGSPVEAYLKSRKLGGSIPATIRYLPPSRPDHHPAMMTAYAIAQEAEPGILAAPVDVVAVHLTLLRADGSGKADTKPNKITVGPCSGTPLVLAPPNDLLGLAITEGIEDGLSVHTAAGLGVWAAGSASVMPALAGAVPQYMDAISIFEDDDVAGQRGARALLERLCQRGLSASIMQLGGTA